VRVTPLQLDFPVGHECLLNLERRDNANRFEQARTLFGAMLIRDIAVGMAEQCFSGFQWHARTPQTSTKRVPQIVDSFPDTFLVRQTGIFPQPRMPMRIAVLLTKPGHSPTKPREIEAAQRNPAILQPPTGDRIVKFERLMVRHPTTYDAEISNR
jgi:hypothetical protein